MGGSLLVVDLGTSALKAVVFGARGETLAIASRPITTRFGADQSHEQDPDEWWSALREAVKDLPESQSISAVAFSGSMQNLIALDDTGRPAGQAALYSDRRLGVAEIDELAARLPQDYAQRTGNRLDPAHTMLKLMARNRFASSAGRKPARWTFGAKDALTFRMTGQAVIDPTTASTTGLMNLAERRWDAGHLKIADVDEAALPLILPADALVGHVTKDAAEQIGLPAGIPVFNGSGDAGAATWGAAADAPGAAYCYLGTTGWVAATLEQTRQASPRDIYTLADPLRPDCVIIVSPFLTAGSALEWLSKSVGQPIDRLLEEASRDGEAAPGQGLFLPYLGGERAPFEDGKVRGALLGLDHNTSAGALALAVMEGIAFAVRHNLEAAGLPASTLTVIGGAARHELQRQILADVLGRKIAIPDDSEIMTARGVLKMVAAQAGITVDAAKPVKVVAPRPTHSARHNRRYAAYLAASSFARAIAKDLD